MTKNSPRLLMTGARGFIGSACLDLFSQEEMEIYATSSQPVNEPAHRHVTWIQTNLLKEEDCKKLIETVRPTHLLHLAWTAKPGKFWKDPENIEWLQSSLSLFKAFFKNEGEHAIGLGTCAEYESNHETCTESLTPTFPSSLYGACKLSCGIGAQAIANAFNKKMTWGRLFCPYGPSESPGRFLPDIVDHLLRQESIACGSGYQIRDYIYVKDVAHILLALFKEKIEGVINIGSGNPVSLRDVAKIVTHKLGSSELIQFGERPSLTQDADRVVANVGRLKEELQWTPLYSLEEGIKEMIECRSQFIKK